MKQIFSDWDIPRMLRLIMSIALGVYAWHEANGMIGILAAWLSSQAIFNIGCCGTQGCGVPSGNPTTKASQEITYEKITTDKKS